LPKQDVGSNQNLGVWVSLLNFFGMFGDHYTDYDTGEASSRQGQIFFSQGTVSHWDFLPKFISLHYYTTLEGVLGVHRSGQAQGTIIYLFRLLFFSQNGVTLKKATKIIEVH
jgi:hypothetical protein